MWSRVTGCIYEREIKPDQPDSVLWWDGGWREVRCYLSWLQKSFQRCFPQHTLRQTDEIQSEHVDTEVTWIWADLLGSKGCDHNHEVHLEAWWCTPGVHIGSHIGKDILMTWCWWLYCHSDGSYQAGEMGTQESHEFQKKGKWYTLHPEWNVLAQAGEQPAEK